VIVPFGLMIVANSWLWMGLMWRYMAKATSTT
jgi:hypothetical protein